MWTGAGVADCRPVSPNNTLPRARPRTRCLARCRCRRRPIGRRAVHPAGHDVARPARHGVDPMNPIAREDHEGSAPAELLAVERDVVELEIPAVIVARVGQLKAEAHLARRRVGPPHVDVPVIVIGIGLGVAHEIGQIIGDEAAQIEPPVVRVHGADVVGELADGIAGLLVQGQSLLMAAPCAGLGRALILDVVSADAPLGPVRLDRGSDDLVACFGREMLADVNRPDARILQRNCRKHNHSHPTPIPSRGGLSNAACVRSETQQITGRFNGPGDTRSRRVHDVVIRGQRFDKTQSAPSGAVKQPPSRAAIS